MLKKIDNKKMGTSDLGWLKSKFHFSFANYYNPANLNFGALRVINDDIIKAGTGFDTHPHKDMEIITYVVRGALTHGDSMGNHNTISRGHVQYMSAGTGIFHSEHNQGKEELRSLQIWIYPDKKDYTPNYGDYRFEWNDRHNQWLLMVSGQNNDAPIKINQDVNIYSLDLDQGNEISFPVPKNRQAYLLLIEGEASVNDITLIAQDALEITGEDIQVLAKENSHIIIFEMNR